MGKKGSLEMDFGVTEGATVELGDPAWTRLKVAVGTIVEVAIAASNLSLSGEELWCAVLATEVGEAVDGGVLIQGWYLGGEDEIAGEEAVSQLHDSGLHLCVFDPCAAAGDGGIHATRVRLWKPDTFSATYLTAEGAEKVSTMVADLKRKAAATRRSALRKDTPKQAAKPKTAATAPKRKQPSTEVIDVSDGDDLFGNQEEEVPAGEGKMSRGDLRRLFRETKERLYGGVPGPAEGGWTGGQPAKATGPAAAKKGLTSGTSLIPHQGPVVSLSAPVDTRDTGMKNWTSKLEKKTDCGSVLLAQAVQNAEKNKRRKKKDKGEEAVARLVSLLSGGKSKKKKKSKKRKKKEKQGLKKDPEDPDSSSSYGEDGDSSSGDLPKENKEEEDESSCEPPLRRKANRRPGSVMEMLVKHAQEQLDRGSLTDPQQEGATLTQGIKVATYFALLIRPYFPAGSPLLRELFSLAQAIDLLRAGRLPETADALAARFVACHTALSEGHWGTAAQLELHPLEPTQSTTTATMLQAQKHKKLVWKSQGYVPQRPWNSQGKGKGGYGNGEKGKKGGGKEKGRGRGRGNQKGGDWSQGGKGESNPWKDNKKKERRRSEEVRKRRRAEDAEDESWAHELAKAVLSEACRDANERGMDESVLTSVAGRGNELEGHRLADDCTWIGLEFFKKLAEECSSFARCGRALVWLFLRAPTMSARECLASSMRNAVNGRLVLDSAVHRREGKSRRSLLPLPLGVDLALHDEALRLGFTGFCEQECDDEMAADCWRTLAILGINGVAGFGRAPIKAAQSAAHRRADACVLRSTKRVLDLNYRLKRPAREAEKELASRYLSYTGEEVPKMQVIGLEQVREALPPESHGGSIDAVALLSEGSKRFMMFPDESLLPSKPKHIKLQAKVHVEPAEQLELAKLLVKRRICVWVEADSVLEIEGEKVFNGMFAVGKGASLPSGKEIQRLIMNLVPTNSVLKQLQGATSDLPAITQYLSMVLHGDERLVFYQSDMSAAFYLFRIPSPWNRMMAFNLAFDGADLGLVAGVQYHLACGVIPMGWGSAVSIMQEVADRLTQIGRLPEGHKVRKSVPLPPWLLVALKEGEEQRRAWYHVYLDNFCAMEKIDGKSLPSQGKQLHESLEEAWDKTGVLSSAKKRVSGAPHVQELGAWMEGNGGTMGPSSERLLKLIQSTLVVLGDRRLKRKWVQVIAGRWVHVLSFRRPGMVVLDAVWKYISAEYSQVQLEDKVRGELLGLCCMSLLWHTNLRAEVSKETTASDASMLGGAVGVSECLTLEGKEFVQADLLGGDVEVIPVLVLSLFNGVGCAFRCYDLCGVTPAVGISYEVNASANRVVAQRWPNVIQEKDVRDLTVETVRAWQLKYPQVEEVHIWGGFPCVDLSAVRAFRLNLSGPNSGLFWEMVRIIKLIKQVFGFRFPVKYGAENVASMDKEAEEEISRVLGVKPWLMDSADAVPVHRPRFCWTNVEWQEIEGVEAEEMARWWKVSMVHDYPQLEQWLSEGAEWPGYWNGNILPTCMKSIKRERPPPKPAGLDKADPDTVLRWKADSMRFPPYQYSDRFIIWVNNRWRLINATERELLHGMGFEHTLPCWNANQVKADPEGFEDARKSLVGDSFNCHSFCVLAAMLVAKWKKVSSYHELVNRMGMAPGFVAPLETAIPLARRLAYGMLRLENLNLDPTTLNLCLLRRTNHTGSDVRISSGLVMNPKAFPRQAVNSSWWVWKKVFANKWKRCDHINSLELRSIVNSVEWRISHLKIMSARIFHLTDSYVCISIISKGRTSSLMLRPLLQRLAAHLLLFDLYLVVAHVGSLDNPTDDASRAV